MKIKVSEFKKLVKEAVKNILAEEFDETMEYEEEAVLPTLGAKKTGPVAVPAVAKPAISVPTAKAPAQQKQSTPEQGAGILQGILKGDVDPLHLDTLAKDSLNSFLKSKQIALALEEEGGLEEQQLAELQETIDQMVAEAFGATDEEVNAGGFGDGDEINEGKLPPGLAKFMAKKKGKKTVKEEKPSAGLTKKQKSTIVKKAKAGKDIGKKGKGFKAVEKKAKASGADDPKAVAAASMWKSQAKKHGK